MMALETTAESLLGDLKSQNFNLTDAELDALSESIKGELRNIILS